jgi:hypothetical protein
MAGTNLEARGLYIPRPLTPSRFTPHSPPRTLSPQCHCESSAISDEPPPGTLRRWPLFRHKLASSSSYLEILDVISTTPLNAMDPESSHRAAASEPAENSVRSSDMESAMPETSGGSWDPYNLDEETVSSLEHEGRIAAKEISRW